MLPLLITPSLMKRFLLLAAIFATSLHAETIDDFTARVTAASESKDPDKIVALYGNPQKLDAEFKNSVLERWKSELKDCRIKSVLFYPHFPQYNPPIITTEEIYHFPPSEPGSISLSTINILEGTPHTLTTMIPVAESEELYRFARGKATRFEWAGEKISQFSFRFSPAKSGLPIPSIIVVEEICGRSTWSQGGGNSYQTSAHKILQLIIPPTDGYDSLVVEISKDNAEPFFKKTIDTSKGAIIPIESKTL